MKLRIVVALIVWSLAFSKAYAVEEIKLSQAQIQALGVETIRIMPAASSKVEGLSALVVVPPGKVQLVTAPVAGLVQFIGIAANESVTKRKVIARLESPGLLEMQRTFLQASTQAQLAQETAGREQALYLEGIIPESRFAASRSANYDAQAQVLERRASLSLAGMSDTAINALEKNRKYSSKVEITAPADGVIIEQMVTLGQRLDTSTPMFKIADLSRLWLEIQLPARRISEVTPNSRVNVSAFGTTAKLISTGRRVDSANQTVTLRAEITESRVQLRPGQFVEADIEIAATNNAKEWKLPIGALLRQQDRTFVFVQTPTGFRAVAVEVANETAQAAILKTEFKGDEQIVVRGTAGLKALWQNTGG